MHVPTTCNTLGLQRSLGSHRVWCALPAALTGPSYAAQRPQGVMVTVALKVRSQLQARSRGC